jgi:hypothetical protein
MSSPEQDHLTRPCEGSAPGCTRSRSRPRDSIVDVGRETRAFIKRLIEAEIARGDFAVTLAVLHQLPTYSRRQDRIFVDRLAALTGQRHTHVARTLRKLSAAGALIYDGGRGNSASWISLDVPAPLQPPIMAAVRSDHSRSAQSDQGWSPTEKIPEQQQVKIKFQGPPPSSEPSFAANGQGGQGADFVGQEEDEHPQTLEFAAAKPEAPRETEIRRACELHAADRKVVEPIARQLTGDVFAEISDLTTERFLASRGRVRNRAGLFVMLLRDAAEKRRRELENVVVRSTMPIAEEVVIDARTYAAQAVPWEVARELLTLKLRKRGLDSDAIGAALETSRAAYQARQDELGERA